jgi:hypothetical protein
VALIRGRLHHSEETHNMKALALSLVALGALSVAANAEPVKLSKAQMDQVVAGANPNIGPNGTNVNSNGASSAPGNSFKAPGQTNNPNPGK